MKAIIFYYSNSGKTKDVATKIQENLGRSKFAARPVMLTIKENSRERQDAQTHKFRRTAR